MKGTDRSVDLFEMTAAARRAEARMFLRDLTEHATQREFVYSHAWKPQIEPVSISHWPTLNRYDVGNFSTFCTNQSTRS